MSKTDIISIVVFGLALVALFIYVRWRASQTKLPQPTEWQIKGTPPDGLYVALAVIRERSIVPFERWGGIIEWIDGPFYCGFIRAAGCLDDANIPSIRLMKFDKIEQTALAHEIAHVMWLKAGKGDGERTPEFYAWIAATNQEIAKQLGRA